MTRKEKESYLIGVCDWYGFRRESKEFQNEVEKLSDWLLDLKIEELNAVIFDLES